MFLSLFLPFSLLFLPLIEGDAEVNDLAKLHPAHFCYSQTPLKSCEEYVV